MRVPRHLRVPPRQYWTNDAIESFRAGRAGVHFCSWISGMRYGEIPQLSIMSCPSSLSKVIFAAA